MRSGVGVGARSLLSVVGAPASTARRGVAVCAAAPASARSVTAPALSALSVSRRRAVHFSTRIASSSSSAASTSSVSSSSHSHSPFAALGLRSPYLASRLAALGIRAPTEIQRAAMPALCAGESVLLGAETGSGKSLTYLLPALDWLLSSSVVSAASQAGEQGRRYPRVVILQPNRELCQQLESVIASVIGPSGSRELPVTPGAGGSASGAPATTQLHYACMTGTQLFPPPPSSSASSVPGSQQQLDILICTPSSFVHNVPLTDLARTRAKAIKSLRAEALAAEEAARTAGGEEAAAAMHASHAHLFSPSFTPTSTPGAHPRSFDSLAFISAQRRIILDEADMLLEGGFASQVKKLLETVWIKFEPAQGLERMTTQARRNRWRREKKKPKAGAWQQQQQQQGGVDAEEEDLDALEAANEDSSLHPSGSASSGPPPPFGAARQFCFVGATLSNISPLACFQYLLNIFTPSASQPPLDRMGPLDLAAAEWEARGCHLRVKLSSGFHHLSPGMSLPGTVEWARVGGEPAAGTRKVSKAWDPETGIDESRLRAVDAAGRRAIGADGSDLESGLSQQEQAEADARFIAAEAEALSLRSASARKIMKKTKRKPGAFGAALPLEGSSSMEEQPTRLTDPADLEKIDRTVRFLNARTPSPAELRARAKKMGLASSAAPPPLKSLLFVSGTARVDTLLLHLRALQAGGGGTGGLPGLSPHVQLLPYHADLKPDARAASLRLFNSSARATSATVAATIAANPAAPPPGITHQVLLCTSLAARGLDFAAITSPSFAPTDASANSGVLSARDQKAGFESLVQFDLARDAIDYIHRCGRMFRHRPAATPASVAAASDAADHAEESESHDDAASLSAAATAGSPSSVSSTPAPKILNLYTAQDELLVGHLRRAESSSTQIVSDSADASAAASASASSSAPSVPLAVNALCPFSSKPVVASALTLFEGRTVGFCNPGCRDKFAADPSAFPEAVAKFREAIAAAAVTTATDKWGAHVPDSAFSRKRRLRTKAKQQARREHEAAEWGSHNRESQEGWDERVPPPPQDAWKQ